jgi:hypothetical protein
VTFTLRETFNNANPNEYADAGRQCSIGELLGFLLQAADYTETDVVPSGNVATLANTPSQVIDVVSTDGTFTGRLKLKIGGTPFSGEAVWGGLGSKAITLAAADEIAKVSVKYTRADLANTKVGILERQLGQRDAGT